PGDDAGQVGTVPVRVEVERLVGLAVEGEVRPVDHAVGGQPGHRYHAGVHQRDADAGAGDARVPEPVGADDPGDVGHRRGRGVEPPMPMSSRRPGVVRRGRPGRAEHDQRGGDRTETRERGATNGFAVTLFDVDYFKSVNDAYGHGRGDEVLQQLAARVNQLVRGYDVLFRYGGDEFVLLLPETEEADAVRVALRLTEGVRGTDF